MEPIKNITAEEIFDSRGVPTLRVVVETKSGQGEFAVPSGASTGTYEAVELRDNNPGYADGKGVGRAILGIEEEILPALKGLDVTRQEDIDVRLIELDGTPNKSRLGGNATIGVSVAALRAAAAATAQEPYEYLRSLAIIKPSRPAPFLYFNLINGGKHADSRLAFQEYHVVPLVDSVSEALQMGQAIQTELAALIRAAFGEAGLKIGNEGGFALDVESVIAPLELLTRAASQAGLEDRVAYALDVAATSFYVESEGHRVAGKLISTQELSQVYIDIMNRLPMISIEDPFYEEDFQNFAELQSRAGDTLIVGDDLTVTNADRLIMAINEKSVKALIVKPNQVGTMTETIETIKLARAHDLECIVSHRSGETEDNFIADLAYAFGCFGIKAGAPGPAERMAKYERLIAIEKQIA